MSEGVKKIENNTGRFIYLPPADDFPAGIKLLPGLNTVPNRYMDQLLAKELKVLPKKGYEPKKGEPLKTRFPGRELIAQLQERVKIVTTDGAHFGPQITIYDAEQVGDRPDGPELPDFLDAYADKIALKLVENVDQLDKLEAWAQDRRPEIASAAKGKLALLRQMGR